MTWARSPMATCINERCTTKLIYQHFSQTVSTMVKLYLLNSTWDSSTGQSSAVGCSTSACKCKQETNEFSVQKLRWECTIQYVEKINNTSYTTFLVSCYINSASSASLEGWLHSYDWSN